MKYLLPLLLFTVAFAPDKPAYRLYTQKLKPTEYRKLLKEAGQADIVLFGELHNNPICHWIELQLTKDLYAEKGKNIMLGAEMFEADNQSALTDYLNGKLSAKELPGRARLWTNYETDYKPLVEFARQNHIPFVATNIPRRYASLVARQGFSSLDTLTAEAKRQMAPLPITVDLNLPGYKAMLDMGHPHGNEKSKGAVSEGAANFARAQAIKDATMAHFILRNRRTGTTFLHFNGAYHSNNFEGIVWYLKQQQPDLTILTISSIEASDVGRPDKANADLADFILNIPEDMTKTY